MTIERGTEQEIRITIKGWDLSQSDIYATFKQDGVKTLTRKTMDSVTYENNKSVIVLTLTQAETIAFKDKTPGKLQVRWIDPDGTPHKTKTAAFDVDELLYEAVLTKDDDGND